MEFSLAQVIAIFTFAVTTLVTPGPNNVMLLSSGLTFGYKKTIKHILGIVIGFPLMAFFIGIGLGVIFLEFPILPIFLKYAGTAYLVFLAYKIAVSKSVNDDKVKTNKPLTFIQSATFQWLNPKGWMISISAMTLFIDEELNRVWAVAIICIILLLGSVISANTWALGGVLLKKFIKKESTVVKFNICMAILLIISIIPFHT